MIAINATLVVQIINLLILMWLLNRIWYRPLRDFMAQRQHDIQRGIAQAEDQRLNNQQRLANFEQSLRDGRLAVRQSLADLREETARHSAELLAKTQEEAKARQQKAQEDIASEMQAARAQVKAQAEAVARSMATAVLGRGIS